MKINNKYISEDDLITSYNVARKCNKVFVEAVTHDQFENIKNEHSKIISKNDILIVYKNTRLEICENDVIFCHSNFIHELFFLLKNIDNLKNIKLVTSQSDVKITKQLFKTKPKCISEWYGINIDYEHEKLFPIPLGIANNYSPKNLTYSNFLAKEKVSPKLKKIYCNYNPNTNNYERKNIKDKFISNDLLFFDEPNLSFEQYSSRLREYEFVLCPWGNGFDTHRLWEALYAGSIPVTLSHLSLKSFEEFPIILLDSYSEFNIKEKKFDDFKYFFNEKLNINWWFKQINNFQLDSDDNYVEFIENKELHDYNVGLFFKQYHQNNKVKYRNTIKRKIHKKTFGNKLNKTFGV